MRPIRSAGKGEDFWGGLKSGLQEGGKKTCAHGKVRGKRKRRQDLILKKQFKKAQGATRLKNLQAFLIGKRWKKALSGTEKILGILKGEGLNLSARTGHHGIKGAAQGGQARSRDGSRGNKRSISIAEGGGRRVGRLQSWLVKMENQRLPKRGDCGT